MKKTILKCLPLLLFFAITACSKKDDNSSNISETAVSNTITASGNWRITYYYDTDHEETVNYNGYAFTFASNGTLTATKTGTTINGFWSTGTDDSKTKLNISFTTPPAFAELSDDWHVVERTDTKIRLEDVSGGGSGTDYLTFEKN